MDVNWFGMMERRPRSAHRRPTERLGIHCVYGLGRETEADDLQGARTASAVSRMARGVTVNQTRMFVAPTVARKGKYRIIPHQPRTTPRHSGLQSIIRAD